jgi:hypothetical protein
VIGYQFDIFGQQLGSNKLPEPSIVKLNMGYYNFQKKWDITIIKFEDTIGGVNFFVGMYICIHAFPLCFHRCVKVAVAGE